MYLSLKRLIRTSVPIGLLLLCAHITHAQDHTLVGWMAWFNGVRIQETSWGMHSDVQFRTGKDWSNNSTILIRPGINYHLSNSQTISAGYAATLVTDRPNNLVRQLNEHRIWEQYTLFSKTLNIPTQHRFRLEQRFLNVQQETVFTQRARYFIRGIIPLKKPDDGGFTTGLFTSVQNELFLNIHNHARLNKSFFDQNRLYASFGHRFVSKYDLELGYMNQFIKGNDITPNSFAHIIQVAAYSRF